MRVDKRLLAGSFAALALLALGLFLGLTAGPARAADPIQVAVCINDSGGSAVVPGTTSYQIGAGSIIDFGTTMSGDCKVRDFPTGTGNVTIRTTYNGTGATLTQNVSTSPTFTFQTRKLTLRLETCSGSPLDGGVARFGAGSVYTTRWFPNGVAGVATGTSAPGEVSGEVFPGTYSFEMQYRATADHVTNANVVVPAADSTLTWKTTGVTINYPGSVSYGGSAGDSLWFKQTAAPATVELLPGTYTFHFRDIGATPGFTTDLTFSGCSFTYGDDTAPAVVVSTDSAPDGSNGWFKTAPVTGTVRADDTATGGSNITSIDCTGAGTLTNPVGIGTAPVASYAFSIGGDGVADISCTATDAAGNTSAPATTLEVKVDTTPPTLAPSVSPNPVAFNGAATASANATDATSGIASQSCDPVDTSVPGTHSVSCTATDNAGNSSSASATYTVASPLDAGKTTCNGVYSGSGKDVEVEEGDTCTLLAGTQVAHDVKVEKGATLITLGTTDDPVTIGHDVKADKAAALTICGTSVDHDLTVNKTSGDVTIGGAGCGNTIGHDLKVEESAGAVTVSGYTVGHDLTVRKTSGDVTIGGAGSGNTIGHDLKVEENGGAVTVSDNTVGNNLSVRKNTPGPVTVSANSAGHDATCNSNDFQGGSGNTAVNNNSCPL